MRGEVPVTSCWLEHPMSLRTRAKGSQVICQPGYSLICDFDKRAWVGRVFRHSMIHPTSHGRPVGTCLLLMQLTELGSNGSAAMVVRAVSTRFGHY